MTFPGSRSGGNRTKIASLTWAPSGSPRKRHSRCVFRRPSGVLAVLQSGNEDLPIVGRSPWRVLQVNLSQECNHCMGFHFINHQTFLKTWVLLPSTSIIVIVIRLEIASVLPRKKRVENKGERLTFPGRIFMRIVKGLIAESSAPFKLVLEGVPSDLVHLWGVSVDINWRQRIEQRHISTGASIILMKQKEGNKRLKGKGKPLFNLTLGTRHVVMGWPSLIFKLCRGPRCWRNPSGRPLNHLQSLSWRKLPLSKQSLS